MYTLYYWTSCSKFYGRGGPILLTLKEAKAEYEVKEPTEAPEGSGFATPIMTFPDGLTISQTPAIVEVLGETFGLNGETPSQKILTKQYLLDLSDIFSELMAGKFADEARKDKWLALFEKRLEGKTFFLSDKYSVVDFFAIFLFEWLVKKDISLEKYPNLIKWWTTSVKEIPVVKSLYESGIPMIP